MKEFWEHGWKWLLVGIFGLIALGFILPIAHNMESGRDGDQQERGKN